MARAVVHVGFARGGAITANPLVLDCVQNLDFRGPIDGVDRYGVAGSPGDGPYAQIWLVVENGVITRAAFKTPGCPSSTAAGSVLCRLVTGRRLDQAASITGDDLLTVLGGLPEGKEAHAHRVVRALQSALSPEGEKIS